MICGHVNAYLLSSTATPQGIKFVNSKSENWDGNNSTRVISFSGLGLQEDDFVIVEFFVIASSAGDMNLQPVTSGYTEHCDIWRDDSITLNFGVFTKKMGAVPDTDVTIQSVPTATGNNNWAMVKISAWRYVDPTTPLDVAIVSNSGVDTASATTPAITPITSGAVAIDAAASCVGNGLNLLDHNNPGSYGPFIMSRYAKGVSSMGAKLWPGAGAMGPYNHGGGAGSVACWAALHMALRPKFPGSSDNILTGLPRRYWRVRSSDTTIAGDYMACTELQLRATSGGADETTGKTATASATFGSPYLPPASIDDNAATFWTTGGAAPPSGGHWLHIDLGAGNEKIINEVVYTSRIDGVREDPRNLFIESSPDGVTWATEWSVASIPAWSANETRVFTRP